LGENFQPKTGRKKRKKNGELSNRYEEEAHWPVGLLMQWIACASQSVAFDAVKIQRGQFRHLNINGETDLGVRQRIVCGTSEWI
jgi:hypothetical protein